MSYLGLPRLGFKGAGASVNPSTANNADNAPLVDNGRVTVQKVPSSPDPKDYAAYRAWLMSLVAVQLPAASGAAPRTILDMPGEWNYYGDHATTFGGAAINSIWPRDGQCGISGPDAVLGARVAINARLVDLDPADNYSTQIIGGLFKIVEIGAGRQPVDLLTGVNPSVAYSRWINYRRPLGAAIFQWVIPTERLTLLTGYSAALDALAQAVAQGAGISVRYCLYALRHTALSSEELHEKFQQGDYVMNPRIGQVLGSIGVWHAGDMRSVPVGRLLF
ncbi:MAG: hypothetical protein ACRDIE_03605, partial [Chloroflexota bacterium]